MTMATETIPTCTTPERGFDVLPCIKCGEDTEILLYLSDCATFRCSSCENEFNTDEVSLVVHRWQQVLAKINRMFAE